MPTYQYACTSDQCGLRFERVQAFTDPAVSECPDCNERVRKVYGSVGVVFKGSGFYRNDSRDAKTGAKAKPDGGSRYRRQEGRRRQEHRGSQERLPVRRRSPLTRGRWQSVVPKAESPKPAANVAS